MKNKVIKISVFALIVIVVIGLAITFYSMSNNLNIQDIKYISYNEETNKVTLEIQKTFNSLGGNFTCYAVGQKGTFAEVGVKDKCTFELDLNDKYQVYLTNDKNAKSKTYSIEDKLNNVLAFKFNLDTIYLIPEESKEISYSDVTIGNVNYDFMVKNPSIAKIEGTKVTALSAGETEVYSKKTDKTLKIVVTNLLTKPYAIKDKKEILPCEAYTEEEATLLDNILEYKINEAGYETRAGALAAARFLTLEFQYRVPYFYETGRIKYDNPSCNMSNINTREIDGEGRYYHKGLYLTASKRDLITMSHVGPATWGCKMKNLEGKSEYGFVPGKMMPNGLDCSGFVTWSLKNGGFEPGDVGAGEDPGRNCQCTDLGEFVALTGNLLDSGKVKAGDLINWWGHIAMIIGIDEKNDTYYIGESLSYIGGVRAMIYTRSELLKTFKWVVLMDNFYKEDGNYTKMWSQS